MAKHARTPFATDGIDCVPEFWRMGPEHADISTRRVDTKKVVATIDHLSLLQLAPVWMKASGISGGCYFQGDLPVRLSITFCLQHTRQPPVYRRWNGASEIFRATFQLRREMKDGNLEQAF
ncbi:MAG TPA: hypothetical protein PK620_00320 [Denitromonas sp.]|nr:hypothetical protein [Denitromonas sp.]